MIASGPSRYGPRCTGFRVASAWRCDAGSLSVIGPWLDADAEAPASQLADRGVETRPFFLGLHEQPVFPRRGRFTHEHFPVAERLARQGLYLQSGLGLRRHQIEQVTDFVRPCLT